MKRMLFAVCAMALLSLCSCGNRRPAPSAGQTSPETLAVPDTIPPLKAGVFETGDDVFGEEISLSGDTVKTDDIFRVGVSTMIIRDSVMLVCCNEASPFRFYSLPDLTFTGSSAHKGRGPMEFIRPEIWPYDSPEYLALVSDEAKVDGSLARIRRDGTLEKMPHRIPDRYSGSYSYTRGYAADSQGRIAFVYRSGLYLYDGRDTSVVADSTVKKIADLRLKGQSAGSTMNIGSLGVNFKYQRMVWAYKYKKRVLVCDMEGNVRVIQFKTPDTREAEGAGMDANVTRYWKLYSGKEYFYLLYSGRTPADVVREQERGIYYIYVEQFDWNGNPVKRYRLDNWGFISVDESARTLYFLSNVSEFPFFIYHIL